MVPPTAEQEENSDTSQADGENSEKDTSRNKGEFNSFNKGGFSMMGGSGSNLNYTNDDLDSYSTIWNCEVTDTTKADHTRVVTALRNISEGTDLENYMDIDNLLRYAAVHIFSVNTDSLSGMMAHNYYLYESNGMLNILPWDYNLSLGGMGGMGGMGGSGKEGSSGATSTINDPIDNAFSGTNFFDTLLADEEYHEMYYEYMQQLVDGYLLGGGFEEFYQRTRSQIDELVKTDPNALYTYEEYEKALEVLCEVVNLRGQSIDGQLKGTIPSVQQEQTNSNAFIDASHIDLSVMGSMSMGGGFNMNDRTGNKKEEKAIETEEEKEMPQTKGERTEEVESTEVEQESSQAFNPSGFKGQMPEGFDPSEFGGQMPERMNPSESGAEKSEASSQRKEQESENKESMTTGSRTDRTMPNMNFGGSNFNNTMSGLVLYGVSFLILIGGLVFATLFKRKKNRR